LVSTFKGVCVRCGVRVQGFRVQGLGLMNQGSELGHLVVNGHRGLGFRIVSALWFRVQGSRVQGSMVKGQGSRVKGLGSRVQGLGFGVASALGFRVVGKDGRGQPLCFTLSFGEFPSFDVQGEIQRCDWSNNTLCCMCPI
jgi:hypothetical protein